MRQTDGFLNMDINTLSENESNTSDEESKINESMEKKMRATTAVMGATFGSHESAGGAEEWQI